MKRNFKHVAFKTQCSGCGHIAESVICEMIFVDDKLNAIDDAGVHLDSMDIFRFSPCTHSEK